MAVVANNVQPVGDGGRDVTPYDNRNNIDVIGDSANVRKITTLT